MEVELKVLTSKSHIPTHQVFEWLDVHILQQMKNVYDRIVLCQHSHDYSIVHCHLEAQYILSFTTHKILFCMKWILDIHKSNNYYLYSSARYKVLRMASMWQTYYWNEQNDGIKDYNRESPYVDQNLCRL